MTESKSFQDRIPENGCFGCGPENEAGLQIKSYWRDEHSATCRYQPQPHQSAGPPQFVNGGIIATLIDCHAICTAVADAYRREQRDIGSGDPIWYVTGELSIKYQRPTPIDQEVEVLARIVSIDDKRTLLRCTLSSADEKTAEAEVVAIRVPASWRGGRPN